MSTTTTRSPEFIPDDLLIEFLSLLPVKSLLRFKCVTKSWNALISDPNFVKFHLNKSNSRNPHFTLIIEHMKWIKRPHISPYKYELEFDDNIVPYPINSFLDNPSFTLSVDHCYLFREKDCSSLAGFCNGLLCLTDLRFTKQKVYDKCEYSFRLWNPATRAISEKFGSFQDFTGFNFNFGCDNSTGSYKVIASRYIHYQLTSEVRVFSDNVWRHIENFPVVPLHGVSVGLDNNHKAMFFNGTLNWLAIHNDTPYTWYHQVMDWYGPQPEEITVKQFVILSLDLETETYNQYMLPEGFDEVPPVEPTFSVLGNCFCFSYSYRETDLIIWQMKKFRDETSWTQFLKISYHDLQLGYDFSADTYLKYRIQFRPWFLSKDGNTLILSIRSQDSKAIIYNWRDQRVERAKVSVHKTIIDDNSNGDHLCWHLASSFDESLIPIC